MKYATTTILAIVTFIKSSVITEAAIKDVTIISSKHNPDRVIKKILKPSTFYIDFETGNDMNSGTKEKPWKHHPWDPNATGNAAKTGGSHRYIFKNGIIYRGSLIADESGSKQNPIYLTNDPEWGKGVPLLLASERITTKWQKCSKNEFPEFSSEILDEIWQTDWNKDYEPHTLLELRNGKVLALHKAREPDWLSWIPEKGDNVKKDFWEIETSYLEFKMTLSDTIGLKIGDNISGTGKWIDKEEDKVNEKQGKNVVTEVGRKYIKVLIKKLKKGEFKPGAYITNGKVRKRILKLSGTHEILSYIGDIKHLSQYERFNPMLWKGGVIWAEDYYGSIVYPAYIKKFDPSTKNIICNFHKNIHGAKKYSRYYIENLPFLLDEPGEFYYSPERKKLFVRLYNDKDPNTTDLEAGKDYYNIKIYNQSNIVIKNLRFTGCNEVPVRPEFRALYWRGGLVNASILIRGNVNHISIENCTFEYLPFGIVSAVMNTDGIDIIDYIKIENCRFNFIGGSAISLSATSTLPAYLIENGIKGRIRHIKILNNYAYNIGFRKLSIWGFQHAITVHDAELAEVAYNKTYRTAGSGVIVFAPSFFKKFHLDVPLQRLLIHNNYAKDSLLSCQDYGGIAIWEGGPSYVYSNVSENPVGYKHVHSKKWRTKIKNWFRTSSFGVGLYADHGYKVYAFNNLIIGTNNNCNDVFYSSCGWNEAAGFLNTFFNNTIYNFAIPIRKGMQEANRSKYLNNMCLNTGLKFFRYDAKDIEFDSIAFANNIFHGKTKIFATVSSWGKKANCYSISEWRTRLKENQALEEKSGWVDNRPQVINSIKHEFMPLPNSKGIDNAAKVFVPWGLYKVQGEWLFYKYKKNPSLILDEHIYWNKNWYDLKSVRFTTPRNDLFAVNITGSSYVYGILEDWIEGALQLNGKSQFCVFPNPNKFNIGKDNFLIEIVLKTKDIGPLVTKKDNLGNGYQLSILQDGIVNMNIQWGKNRFLEAKGTANINDGHWHHLIVELERRMKNGINIYIDGKKLNCYFSGSMQKTPLLNNAILTIGKYQTRYLKCTLDFLRIARGNLKDAETNIKELYNWEFNGPFKRDFYGHKHFGKARDVGAIEYIPKH